MEMEVLGNILQYKFSEVSIGFHPLGKSPHITHLAFADDIMIFFDGKIDSLQTIAGALDVFQNVSGLSMNKDKTSIFHTGLNQIEAETISTLGFQSCTLPICYLGLPLQQRKLTKAEYSPLTDSIAARFNHWAVKSLSFACRLQLINSVIYSLINFWFSAFALPKGCLKAIEQLCNRFLWAGDLTKRASAKVSWNSCCLPKDEGGLGLRNLSIWNKVLNLRLAWVLFSNSCSLWVAWQKDHRLKCSSFWNSELKESDSWIWKFILSLRPLAKQFIGCEIGDGKSASFWLENWSGFGPLIDYLGVNGPTRMGIPITATVAQAFSAQNWQLPSTRTRYNAIRLLRQYLQSVTTPSASRGPDIFTWGLPGNRKLNFSTKITTSLPRSLGIPSDLQDQDCHGQKLCGLNVLFLNIHSTSGLPTSTGSR